MRVLVAGATGAIGKPLVRLLLEAGHEVVGTTRTQRGAEALRGAGVAPVVVDVLDRAALVQALDGRGVDAVVNQLTSIPKSPLTHRSFRPTDRVREVGTRNLAEAARRLGATRFLTQSMLFGYGYAPVDRPHTEDDEFAPVVSGPFEQHLAALRVSERLVLQSGDFEGIALRYGLFYGAEGDPWVADLRRRRLPVCRESRPISWVYVDDAAAATVAALERGSPGAAYNVADDEPASWSDVISGLAAALGAPRPRVLPSWLVAVAAPYGKVVLRGGVTQSSEKAKRELGWAPAVPTYRDGIARIAAVAQRGA